jgi:hypothetical protein
VDFPNLSPYPNPHHPNPNPNPPYVLTFFDDVVLEDVEAPDRISIPRDDEILAESVSK